MKKLNIDKLDFDKVKGLMPAIIQDVNSLPEKLPRIYRRMTT